MYLGNTLILSDCNHNFSKESAAEPNMAISTLNFDYKVTAKNEATAMFAKTICLYLLIKFQLTDPLLSFGAAQLVFSSILYALSIINARR
jgi:hypothetical protein